MNRATALLLTVVLVVGSVSAVPMVVAAQSGSSTAGQTASAPAVTPGERLSGVVGVGQAELEGEMERRAYGIEFASAATADAKADVVADRLDRLQQRLEALEQEKRALEDARENDEISDGEYRSRIAELAARTETVKQLADASEARANSLPEDVLADKDINRTAIQTLRQNAEELAGPEVAEIARLIAGENVGQSVSRGPPADSATPAPDHADDGGASARDRGNTTATGDDGRSGQRG
jgi:hypothetical protein